MKQKEKKRKETQLTAGRISRAILLFHFFVSMAAELTSLTSIDQEKICKLSVVRRTNAQETVYAVVAYSHWFCRYTHTIKSIGLKNALRGIRPLEKNSIEDLGAHNAGMLIKETHLL